jgi:RNA polymerase sigma-70 factor (ECF subfamily)
MKYTWEKEQIINEAVAILLETTQVNIDELESLLLRAKTGDTTASHWPEQVAALLKPKLYSVAKQYGLKPDESEDVMQNTLALITRNLQGDLGSAFRTGSTKGWLQAILQRTAIDFLRRTNRHRKMSNADTMETLPAPVAGPEEQAENQELSETMKKTIAQLPLHFQDVINLVYLKGMPYQAAADELKIPIGTVKSRLNNAITRLRDLMTINAR